MRPDEHKRRKNEKYKKKHGISGSNSTNKIGKKTDSENEMTKTSKFGHKDAQDHRSVKPKPRDDPGVKDEAVARRLPDNWERYEEVENEEDDRFMPEMRGEDFNKLIAESGGSSSRFRFKDEEDWTDISESDKPYNKDVSLNFDNLALALDCIPLCERLGISTDLFTDNQVEEMTRSAIDCKSRYHEKFWTNIPGRKSAPDTKEKGGHIIEGKSNTAENKTLKENEFQTKSTSKSDSNSRTAENSNYDNHDYANSNKVLDGLDKSEQLPKTVNIDMKKADISSLEDDLDSLLSFDLPSTTAVVDDKKLPFQKPSQTVVPATDTTSSSKITEDWLDELLAD